MSDNSNIVVISVLHLLVVFFHSIEIFLVLGILSDFLLNLDIFILGYETGAYLNIQFLLAFSNTDLASLLSSKDRCPDSPLGIH